MKSIASKLIITLFSSLMACMSIVARDLPVTEVGGRQCYVYQVKKGENIYDVSRSLNVTLADITRYNPSAADGLRAGMRLYIPTSLLGDEEVVPVSSPVNTRTEAKPVANTKPTAVTKPDVTPGDTPTTSPTPSTYTVGHGESLYGISRKVNMTIEQLISLNPEAEYGVKQGDVLALTPQGVSSSSINGNIYSTPLTHDEAQSLINERAPIDYSLAPSERELSANIVPVSDPDDASTTEVSDTINMAVMLPFMLHNGAENDKNAKLFIEFYKGLLLAVDSLQQAPGHPIKLYAFDTAASTDTIASIMSNPAIKSLDLIIGPDNDEHLRLIAAHMASKTRLFNTFNVRSSLYNENPHILQANIPHASMLAKAADAFSDLYRQYTPVFLQRIDGDADKDAFTSLLKQRLDNDSIAYHEITFKNMLSPSDLSELPVDLNYVFVPVSGKRAEFAKITEAIRHMSNSRPVNSIRLFGYPDWIVFRGEYFNRLCELEATIYTRFYADMKQPAIASLNKEFHQRYGGEMLDAAPVQGLLGFDTGMYLLGLLKDYGSDFYSKLEPYNGLQSVFDFVDPSPSVGSVNNALLIVTFTSSGNAIKTILE